MSRIVERLKENKPIKIKLKHEIDKMITDRFKGIILAELTNHRISELAPASEEFLIRENSKWCAEGKAAIRNYFDTTCSLELERDEVCILR